MPEEIANDIDRGMMVDQPRTIMPASTFPRPLDRLWTFLGENTPCGLKCLLPEHDVVFAGHIG